MRLKLWLIPLFFIWITLPISPVEAQPNLKALIEPTVTKVRALYPALVDPAEVGEMLNQIAWIHRDDGIKLLKKNSGGRCPAPQGVTVSCDILIWAPPNTKDVNTVHFDVFSAASSDGPTTAGVFFRAHGPCTKRPAGHPLGGSGCSLINALNPVAPSSNPDTSFPVPTVPETPPTPVVDLKPLLDALTAEVARLNADIQELFERLTEESRLRAVDDTENAEALAAHKATDPHKTTCRVSLWGIKIGCSLE